MMRALLGMTLVLAACAHGTPPTTTAAGPVPAGDAVLAVDNDGKQAEIRLGPDGRFVAGGQVIATIDAAGALREPDGNLVATLEADGTVTIPGEDRHVELHADGALVVDGVVAARFDDRGVVTGPLLGDGDHLRASGDRAGRRAFMLLWAGDRLSSVTIGPGPRLHASD